MKREREHFRLSTPNLSTLKAAVEAPSLESALQVPP